jgi:hypothetical protein
MQRSVPDAKIEIEADAICVMEKTFNHPSSSSTVDLIFAKWN